jgi:hypothetical protein
MYLNGVVAMRELFLAFLSRVKERDHLFQLIKQNEFSLTFRNELEEISLAFKNGDVFLQRLQPDYEISGDIETLLTGKESLRVLLRKEQIKLTAPFRIILMLESLCYLAGHQNFQKII